MLAIHKYLTALSAKLFLKPWQETTAISWHCILTHWRIPIVFVYSKVCQLSPHLLLHQLKNPQTYAEIQGILQHKTEIRGRGTKLEPSCYIFPLETGARNPPIKEKHSWKINEFAAAPEIHQSPTSMAKGLSLDDELDRNCTSKGKAA